MVSSPKKYAPQLSRSTGPCVLLCESSGCATSRSSRIDCSECCWVHRLSTMPAVHTPSHLPIAASTFRRPNEDNKLVNIIINLPFLLAAYLRVVSSSSPLILHCPTGYSATSLQKRNSTSMVWRSLKELSASATSTLQSVSHFSAPGYQSYPVHA